MVPQTDSTPGKHGVMTSGAVSINTRAAQNSLDQHTTLVVACDCHLNVAKYASKSVMASRSTCFSRPSGMNDSPVLRRASM